MTESIIFSHPRPPGNATRVWPVFLPHAGCAGRCRFCAQDIQTGCPDVADLGAVRERLRTRLEKALGDRVRPLELGLFGGTFTGLAVAEQEAFLDLARRFREAGLITRVRLSTRPDAVDPAILARLASAGADLIELGVQSFDDRALSAVGRGYGGELAARACRMVREAGLALGLHLMPGLPGVTPAVFGRDVDTALCLEPETVRLHPCLVLRGTPLERDWRAGRYRPWSTARAVEFLGLAVARFWSRGVRVIRVGLSPEETLRESVLAGPWHDSLGQRVASRALYRRVRSRAALLRDGIGRQARLGLLVPRRHLSEVLGWRREMVPIYSRMGLDASALLPWDGPLFVLRQRD